MHFVQKLVGYGLVIALGMVCIAAQAQEIELQVPELQRIDLDNGMPLYHIHLPDEKNFRLQTIVWGGASVDPEGYENLGHVLEHLLFYQPDTPIADFEKEIKSRGGEFNGHTSCEQWSYYVNLPQSDLEMGSDWLYRVLRHDKLPLEHLEDTKAIIRVERGWPDSVPLENFKSAMGSLFFFIESPPNFWEKVFGIKHYHKESGGTLRTIRAKELEEQYATYHVPENMNVVYAGPHPAVDVLGALQPRFGQIPNGQKPVIKRIQATKEPQNYTRYLLSPFDASIELGHAFKEDGLQPHAFRGLYMHVISTLLKDKLRHQESQTYSVRGRQSFQGDAWIANFRFECDHKTVWESHALAKNIVYGDLQSFLSEEDYFAYRADFVRSIFHESDPRIMSGLISRILIADSTHQAPLSFFDDIATLKYLPYDDFLQQAKPIREGTKRYGILKIASVREFALWLTLLASGFFLPLILFSWRARRRRSKEPLLKIGPNPLFVVSQLYLYIFLIIYLTLMLGSFFPESIGSEPIGHTSPEAYYKSMRIGLVVVGLCFSLLFLLPGSFLPARLTLDAERLVLQTAGWRILSIPRADIKKVVERKITLRDLFRRKWVFTLRFKILEIHHAKKRPLRLVIRKSEKILELLQSDTQEPADAPPQPQTNPEIVPSCQE